MFDRMLRLVIGFAVVALLLWMSVGSPSLVRAGQNNITHMDVQPIFVNVPLSSSGTILSTPFRALEKTTSQSVVIQADGASPNYKVELLVTLDRNVFTAPLTVAFTKPEVGGDLYTFTDALAHIFALGSPACLGQQLRVVGQGGGAVQGNINAQELSQ